MDAGRAKELREKIERARAEEKSSLAWLRRERQKQIEAAQCVDPDAAKAVEREYDRFEAGLIAQWAEIIKKWQDELDDLPG